ncbi:MAG: hypothetical protein JJ938_17595 [Roseicyclus sp.]|nr:hypothetical protein [Roseicyclus sp.]MBO6626691.1 hypothetical protein [Roseicyclus sp.]MBO6922355.1 hypothetical protein [Roseicyclus sp.]
MPVPLILWGGVALGGLYLAERALDEAGDAAQASAEMLKWAAIAGGVYLSYQALKSAGALK